MDDLFVKVVKPFCAKGRMPSVQRKNVLQWQQLYLWATAVVSAYSFTLGEDKFQAMVSHHPCSSVEPVMGKMHATCPPLHVIQTELDAAVL